MRYLASYSERCAAKLAPSLTNVHVYFISLIWQRAWFVEILNPFVGMETVNNVLVVSKLPEQATIDKTSIHFSHLIT